AVGQFVANRGADVAVIFGVRRFGVVGRRLENARREIDVVHAVIVVGVDGGRCHAPLAAIHGLADFVDLAEILEDDRALAVAVFVTTIHGELRVVPPVVGITDLVGYRVQLFQGA